MMSTSRLVAFVVAWLCFAHAFVAQARPTDDEIGEMTTFLALFPELRTLPAPPWLQPGARVSYEAVATGVVQYDVVSSDGAQVFAHLHTYGSNEGGLAPFSQGVGRGLPGVGPFWLNPVVLQGAEALSNGNLVVSRYAKAVAGTTLQVVRFQTTTTNGKTVFELDAATGVLVFSSISSPGGAAQMVLQGVRQLPLPWAADRAPNWVRPDTVLQYAGIKTTEIAGGGAPQENVSATTRFAQAGARWSHHEVVTTASNGAVQSGGASTTGSGQLGGGMWIPRSALAAQLPTTLTTLDRDPFTGATLSFMREADGSILLQQALSAARTTWIYDPNLGVLQRMILEKQSQVARETTDMIRVGGSDLAALSMLPELPDDPPPQDPGDAGDAEDPNDPGDPGDPGDPDAPDEDMGDEAEATGGGGGCSVGSPSAGAPWLLALLVFGLHRRDRRPAAPHVS